MDGMTAVKDVWDVDKADQVYGVSRWGKGYFHVGENGDIIVSPNVDHPTLTINMREIVQEMESNDIHVPAVIRFHDILRSQVVYLNRTFGRIIEEAGYNGKYRGVFPVKVNQMREVIEEIVDAGAPYAYGLEAGSKPELMAALAYNVNKDALTILNGYKDEEYLRLALLGQQIGRNIVIVIEKFSEIPLLVKLIKETGVKPTIGLRCKLTVKGKGKWEHSSGERAKFGLSYVEIHSAIKCLEEAGLKDLVKLLHFHLGSQVPDIRPVKEGVQEASMVYVNMRRAGIPVEYIDVGGGLAVDYDGTQSTSVSSCNYSMADYITDVVYGFMQSADQYDVPHPNLVSESGRAVSAYHSCFVTKLMGEIKPNRATYDTRKSENEHILLSNMRDTADELVAENYQAMYNDLVVLKEQCTGAFNLGVLSLEDMAKVEAIYWQTLSRINVFAQKDEHIPDELKELPSLLSSQFLANFSVFQSAMDTWAIGQVLPIVPISRLDEEPTRVGSIADITCDSDGVIKKFVGNYGNSSTLPLHDFSDDEDYYIAIFLTGAYQDVMGDMHNLFGRVNEVHIVTHDDDPKDYYIEEIIRGASMGQVLSTMQYTPEILALTMKQAIDEKVRKGEIAPRLGVKLNDFYEDCLSGYTYLEG